MICFFGFESSSIYPRIWSKKIQVAFVGEFRWKIQNRKTFLTHPGNFSSWPELRMVTLCALKCSKFSVFPTPKNNRGSSVTNWITWRWFCFSLFLLWENRPHFTGSAPHPMDKSIGKKHAPNRPGSFNTKPNKCTNNSPSICQNCHISAAAWSPTTFDSKLQPSHLRRSLWMRSAHMMVACEPLGLATVVSLGFSHLFGFVKRLYRVSIFVLGLGVGETPTFNETTRWNEGNLWFGLIYIYIYLYISPVYIQQVVQSLILIYLALGVVQPWCPESLRR